MPEFVVALKGAGLASEILRGLVPTTQEGAQAKARAAGQARAPPGESGPVNAHVGTGVVQGTRTLWRGVAKGVTGVLMEPIRGGPSAHTLAAACGDKLGVWCSCWLLRPT